jgi:integrase
MSIFESALAAEIEAFIDFKRAAGYRYGEANVFYLKRLDRYCHEQGVASLTKEASEGWATEQISKASKTSNLLMLSLIREFGRYLRANGDNDAYILSDRFRQHPRTVLPYLISEAEISAFFAASKGIRGPHGKVRSVVLPAMFHLMHCLGLRCCEIRVLKRDAVDLKKATIDILDSKGPKDRRLPLSEELVEYLSDYDRKAALLFPFREAFFPSSRGSCAPPDFVNRGFNTIWDLAGLARPSEGPMPRPYSFRHHFAFANIARWAKQGLDTEALMPYLSRFMGHSSLQATYYYVNVSSDIITDVVEIGRALELLIPEVSVYDV